MAIRLETLQQERRASFKDVVNDVLRAGLESLDRASITRRTFRTSGFSLGPSLVGSIDNVEEVLSRAEGDDHR